MVDPVRGRSLAALLLLTIALAGCSDGKEKEEGPDAEGAGTPGPPALAAAIAVEVNGTAVAPANGTLEVPLGDAVTFNATGSTGAILRYSWSFGDDGTSDDRVAEHTYEAPGTYNVTLQVAGAGNATANATAKVLVVGVEAGQPLFTHHVEVEGELPLGNPNSPTTEGQDYVDHVVPIVAADANGTAAQAVAVRIVVEASGLPTNQYFVYWRDPAGADLATSGDVGDTSGTHELSYEGPMPAGDHVLRVRLFFGAQASYTATIDVDYVTA